MDISTHQGENVACAVSLLCGAITRLTIVDKIPANILPKLIAIFCTTSVDKYNSVFQTMSNNYKLGVGGPYSPSIIL